MRTRNFSKFKTYFCYIILFFVLLLLQTSPHLQIKIFSVIPQLILPLIILISMFEDINISLVFALLFGVITDIQSMLFGFNSIIFVIITIITSFLVLVFFSRNILTAILVNLVFSVIYFILEFLISNGFKNNVWRLFVKNTSIKLGFSIVIIGVLYFIFYIIHKNRKFI